MFIMKVFFYYLSLVLVFLVSYVCCSKTIQCRNEDGEAIDWFYIYKLPRERNHINPQVRAGLAYMYLTPTQLKGGWVMSSYSIGDPDSILGKTLDPLYKFKKDKIALIYNDQPPQEFYEPDPLEKVVNMYTNIKKAKNTGTGRMKKANRFKLSRRYYDDYDLAEMCRLHSDYMKTHTESGHTKGVVMGDKTTGMWLVHSVPHFPAVPTDKNVKFTYPASGTKFGQSFLCISMQSIEMDFVGSQLLYNEPLVIHSEMPDSFREELPNLFDVITNKTIENAPWYRIQTLQTLAGRKFLSFAKSGSFNDDLYSGLVAEVLRSDLLVETWTNGPGTLRSECTRDYKVRNIERLKMPAAKMSFTSHQDHSKWAIAVAHKVHNSQDSKVADYWVCVGDINRAISQESRGGGTVCTAGPLLWSNFAQLIESVENCNNQA